MSNRQMRRQSQRNHLAPVPVAGAVPLNTPEPQPVQLTPVHDPISHNALLQTAGSLHDMLVLHAATNLLVHGIGDTIEDALSMVMEWRNDLGSLLPSKPESNGDADPQGDIDSDGLDAQVNADLAETPDMADGFIEA